MTLDNTSANEIQVKLLSGSDAFESLKPEWESLAVKAHNGYFYCRWEYYAAYIQHLLPDQAGLFWFCGEHKATGRFIIPLESVEEKMFGQTLRILRLPLHAHLNLVSYVTELPPDKNTFSLLFQALLPLLQDTDLKWDVFIANNVLFPVKLSEQLHNEGFRESCKLVGSSNYLNINSQSEFEAQVPKKFRKNLARLERRAHSLGAYEAAFITEAEALPAAFEQFLKVEASGWKGQQGTASAISMDPGLRGFYQALIDGFAGAGQQRIHLLRLGEDYVAGQFAIAINGCVSILKIGYDEHFQHVAPGNLLINALVSELLGQFTELSFVTGPKWSERWHAYQRQVFCSHIFNATFKGKAIYSAFVAKAMIKG